MSEQFTAKQVLDFFQELVKQKKLEYSDLLRGYDIPKEVTNSLGEIEEIDGARSDYDDHDQYYKVIKFENCPEYFEGVGYYDSQNGVDFSYCDSLQCVEHKEVVVKQWVPKKF